MRAVHKRYRREFVPAMLAYAAVMLLIWPLAQKAQGIGMKAVLALMPMLPLGLAVRAMVRLVLDDDELGQRLHLIALGVSSAVVGMLFMTLGFLVAAKVLPLSGEALVWVFPAQCLSYGLARKWAGRRYGMGWAEDAGCRPGLPQRLLFAALVVDALAWLVRGDVSDWQFGLLQGLSVALAVGGFARLLARRRAARRDDPDA